MEEYARIYRRCGHIAVAYGNNMIVWGGYMESATEPSTGVGRYHSADEVWIYDTVTDVWQRSLTKGDIPPRSSGSCGVIFDNCLYIFGGYHVIGVTEVGNSNHLFRLNLNNFIWEQLLPEGIPPSPCDKLVCWFYNEKIYFFGGFGPNTYPNNSRYLYIMDISTVNSDWPGRGWNNQFVCYNIAANKWEWPITHGPEPGPRAAHAADITGSYVYMFGGRTGSIRNNEIHVLDMKTMTWSGNLKPMSKCSTWPEGRSWHSLTFISPDTAIVYGGLSQLNVVLNDCWALKIKEQWDTINWKLLSLPYDHGEPCCAHAACFFKNERLLCIHSGVTQPFYETIIKLQHHVDRLLIIPFAPKSLLRICLDTIIDNRIACTDELQLPSTLIDMIERRKDSYFNEVTTIYYCEE
ncbi:kelch domain-containing protein 1-like isoform X2 [Lycorma delicatula]|uniref:kelch domain-containing protein 1-like isoform X2 n=1 Tax=Lycorma delicatula TaxID=130591 RepID=UPI003F5143EB